MEHHNDPLQGLTPAERMVAAELATGKSNEQIAQALHISVKTVKGHLTAIYKATGCKTAREFLVKYPAPHSLAQATLAVGPL